MDNKDFEILGENSDVKGAASNDHIDFFDDIPEVKVPEEVTIKTAKKLVGEPFEAKDGNTYCQVKIPNRDENDKSPWATFVVRADSVHDDKFGGNSKWFKLPADGTTTVSKSFITAYGADGKNLFETRKKAFKNTDLKKIVESYKDRDLSQDRGSDVKSFKDQLAEAKTEASEKNEKSTEKAAKSKSKDKAI